MRKTMNCLDDPMKEFAPFNLTSEERREHIIQVLREQDEVSVVELSRRLGVSEVTTRKDLQQLEEQGYLTRVRGGAVVSGRGQLELRFAARQQVNLEEKRRIAARAVEIDPARQHDLS
jgi:DeoR/GlpR family transcriptional regulator of sugar metabolism